LASDSARCTRSFFSVRLALVAPLGGEYGAGNDIKSRRGLFALVVGLRRGPCPAAANTVVVTVTAVIDYRLVEGPAAAKAASHGGCRRFTTPPGRTAVAPAAATAAAGRTRAYIRSTGYFKGRVRQPARCRQSLWRLGPKQNRWRPTGSGCAVFGRP
jgi:hypothetical protein